MFDTLTGIGHGFYYSLTDNFYLNVQHHTAGFQNKTLPGQVNVSQAEFEKIALGQVTELWSNYGNLSEIWFDGGYGGDMAAGIEKAIKKQPTAVGFGGGGVMPGRGLGWTGTESGHPDCPEGIWSTGGSPCGAANSTLWEPETSDTTLQLFDHWFWTPPATMIRSLKEMITVYHDTVGSNAVMELDFAIDRDGETTAVGPFLPLVPGRTLLLFC